MANALVRVKLQSVKVKYNGDLDDLRDERRAKERAEKAKKLRSKAKKATAKGNKKRAENLLEKAKHLVTPDKDNAITLSLAYPRSGVSQFTASSAVPLTNGGVYKPKNDTFFEAGLLKEEIQGETILAVTVTDKDKRNKILSFFRSVLSSAFGSVAGGLIGGLGGVVTIATANGIKSAAEGAIKGSDAKEREEEIAESVAVRIAIFDDELRVTPNKASQKNKFEWVGNGRSGTLTLDLAASDDFYGEPRKTGPGGRVERKLLMEEGDDNGEIKLSLQAE